MSTRIFTAIFAVFLSITGCASTHVESTPSAIPSTAQDIHSYLNHLERLDQVGARIFQASTELCQSIGRDPGVITLIQSQLPRVWRAQATTLGISSTPSVALIRSNGPATRLQSGDILLGRRDRPVGDNSKAVQNYLAAGFLRIQRGGQEKIIPITAPRACAYRVRLKMDANISANISGGQITISSGLLDFTKTDSELAYVIGHELAHGIKKHLQTAVLNGGFLGIANQKMQAMETDADYISLMLVANAGYDLDGAALFWRRMIAAGTSGQPKGKKHPNRQQRLAVISTSIIHIREMYHKGKTLAQMQKPPRKGGF